MVERVTLQRDILCITERHASQRGDLHKRIMVDIIDTVGQDNARQFCFGKGVLWDTLKCDSHFEGHTGQTALLEHASAHSSQRCRQCYFGQVTRALKGILLNGLDLRALGKGQRRDFGVRKRLTADKGYTCGNRNFLKRVVCKRLCLNTSQRIGQSHASDALVLKRAATGCGDRGTKIQYRQVNLGITSKVFNNGHVTRGQRCILIVAVGNHVGHADIVSADAVIPVFIQICGHGISAQIEIQILGTKECKHTNMFHLYRQCQLGERLTAKECISTHVDHGLGQRQIGKTFTETERKVVNVSDLCISPVNFRQFIHALKTVCLYAGERTSLLKGNSFQI